MNTDKIYAEQLANEYAPKDTSKVVALRKLDAKAKLPANVFTYTFGIITALVAGVGMCLSMKVIGNGSTAMFVLGVIVGIIGLADLEQEFDVHIITQNIDNLHEQAGSSHVVHLHGELMKACSVRDLNTTYDISPENPDLHIGDKDPHGVQLRPFIVWFGEAVPMIDPAIRLVEDCDIFVVIGTSLNVYPAAGLLNYVRRGQPIYLIDPKEVKAYRDDICFIRKGASEGVKELKELLLQNH